MSRERASGHERYGLANFVQNKMSNGVEKAGSNGTDSRRLTEREIIAANARVAVPGLFPERDRNTEVRKADTDGDRNVFDNTDVEDADNTLSTRLSPILSTEATGQLSSHKATTKANGLAQGPEIYDSDGADDASLYSYSGADHGSRWNPIPDIEGFNSSDPNAEMDRMIKKGQDQIRKGHYTYHQSPDRLQSRPRSPLPAPRSRGHSSNPTQANEQSSLHRKQSDKKDSQFVEHFASRVNVPRPGNNLIANKNILHPGIFSTHQAKHHEDININKVKEPKNPIIEVQPHSHAEPSVFDKPELQINTRSKPQTANAPTGLDKISSYTDTSSDTNSSFGMIQGTGRPSGQKSSNKRPLELDYDSPVLANKSLKDLQNENYDDDPRSKPFEFAAFNDLEGTTLPDKLERLSSHSREDRTPFFHSVNMTEWEECGDWLIERFARLMSQLKEGRKARRELAYGFEAEIRAQHEKTERERTDIENMIQTMRTGGIGVMQRSGSTLVQS